RDGSAAVNLRFAAAACAACGLRARCTRSRTGRGLQLNEHYELLAARRAEAQTAAFRAKLRRRAGIEATLSELVRRHELRRHRYRGAAPRELENLLKGAAWHLKRLDRVLATRPPRVAATARRALPWPPIPAHPPSRPSPARR